MVQGGKAGKISKPFGLQGEVQVILNPLTESYFRTGNPLFVDIDGQRVPFFIEVADIISSEQAIVKLEFISSVEEARDLSGRDVYTDPKYFIQSSQYEEDPARVVGYLASDRILGELGRVIEYYPHPVNPQWGISYRGREILVPANPGLVVKTNHKKARILLSLPEGLTEV